METTEHNGREGMILEPKKRKSRFDVVTVPPSASTDELEIPSVPPSSSFMMFNDDSTSTLQALAIQNNIKRVVTCDGDAITYASVVEKAFLKRLDNAMERNFKYIERKDAYALIILGNGGDPFDQSLYPSFKKTQSLSMELFSKKREVPSKPGIGSDVATEPKVATAKPHDVSVYVSNLPKDITEEELDILFSPQGKIKKIKIYTDSSGRKKGDALITYGCHDSVILACGKLNRLDIGDGHVISVTKANFGNKNDNNPSTHTEVINGSSTVQFEKSANVLQSVTIQPIVNLENIKPQIPSESEVDAYPIVLIFNGYDMNKALNDEVYVNTVEMDLLLICCEFGNVRIIQLFQAWSEGNQFPTIAVTFECCSAAKVCVEKLNGTMFNQRLITTLLLLPRLSEVSDVESRKITSEENTQDDVTCGNSIGAANTRPTMVQNEEFVYKQEADSVEDFLNSLL